MRSFMLFYVLIIVLVVAAPVAAAFLNDYLAGSPRPGPGDEPPERTPTLA